MFEELTQILSRQLRVDVEKIDKSADIMEDLGADSLDIVEILMTVEEQFGIAIPEEEFPNLRTVGDLCDYIENNA
ncbi:MAG: acyl carrier protein [Clostridia bacterium]|nr:acyl carrier protein [Clostridia bacterium]MBR3714584.1 acyl carrier protein [Clostridia bacterium]